MRAIVQIVQNDFTLQWRYRIIAAYAVVIAIYFVLIRLWAAQLPDWVVPALIYSDPAVLGFFFLGGLMMLERGENVRAALASSPMSAGQYLFAKSISLTAIALGAVLVLSLAAGRSFEALGLILFATTCASIFFIALGAVLAIRFKTVNAYLIGSVPILLPVLAPSLLVLVEPFPAWALLLPPAPQLKLMFIGFGVGNISNEMLWLSVAALIISTAFAFWAATTQLRHELGQK